MFSDRIFLAAFIISFLIHGIVLFQNLHLNPFNISRNKKEEILEISYIKKEAEFKPEPKDDPVKKNPSLKIPSKINATKINPPPFIDVDKAVLARKDQGRQMLARQPEFTKPTLMKPDVIAIKKKITLPAVDIDKINNPSYLSYYQIVREKIRRAAYQNYTRTDTGEVYLSFVISREGLLNEVRLVEEKSSSISYLREVALHSIQEASPFPDFPKELDYPRLSFNVIISFEVE